ncbi:FxsB family cyclophane-forming radical SAM/SPASM peptide maturase [Spongiactinospora sp. TRM90649]|uniref:FxsB family cyclophane-forming radical SAM/SPASM peptide maturase n=1 Tax=Spongiactinospora sp. TRM90649 TaxID=3031114 RepID=UPI0023F662BB|nr:FxsB family cyclophane-forming radical SAM/SPASM peptide maturase [Spongiactinospora sp. TRM90649]MDF5755843.1 FxsB family radical SAM/SPASM domain protein [Spongiactinospora sp. TRM90649]
MPAPHPDVAALLARGWRPRPFRTFVLKAHSRCDLACDYCYVYSGPDRSWRDRPRMMSLAVAARAAARIAEHAARHRLPSVHVVLHGGEPLLCPPAHLAGLVAEIRRAVAPPTRVAVSAQTNGVRLDETYLRLFAELRVAVGVSLDGTARVHDRHRRTAGGRGSHASVARALALLGREPYRALFSGLLCTVDVRADPIEVYEELLRHSPPAVDFLLPHANRSAPPPGWSVDGTPYADWLIAIFDRWYATTPRRVSVRLFDEIIGLLLGGRSRMEGVGLAPVGVVVVETDGGLEQTDALKSAHDGAAHTGLHVDRDPFDRALLLPGVAARQIGAAALAAECRACPVVRVCGGGHYAHRYEEGGGFANPSVYCRDLYRLIRHIRARVARDLPAARVA